MPPQQLRDYQEEGIEKIMDAWRAGARSVLAIAPTGSGKTTIFTWLANFLAPKPTLINVHRRELATQACTRLLEFGVPHGLVMAGEKRKPYAPVQVAMVQTLVNRMDSLPPAALIINDEAHLSTAETWTKILECYSHARILGVTATPWRLGGKPLAGQYDAVVVITTPGELIKRGFLCGFTGFSYKAPSLADLKKTGDEYNQRDAAKLMSQSLIVDNVVEEYGQHARDLSAVVFNVTVEHSLAVTARFKAAGIRAEHLDGQTPKAERDAILKRVERGQTMVLCNVGVAVEGLDIPRLKCCVLNRPTMSRSRALQMMGRVLRPWNGIIARIHDHAFVVDNGKGGGHGLPDTPRDYSLHTKAERPPSLTRCDVCGAYFQGEACPACGHENEAKGGGGGGADFQTVDTAEKIEFASGQERAPEVTAAPVELRWGSVKPGRVIEGIFEKAWEEQMDWGPQRKFLIKGTRDYVLPGSFVLNKKMDLVEVGSKVWVTYGGMNGKAHEFKVEVDDGQA